MAITVGSFATSPPSAKRMPPKCARGKKSGAALVATMLVRYAGAENAVAAASAERAASRALAASGAGCLALREVLSHDLLGAREALRGVIGGPLPEFLGRLRNLAAAAMLAAAFLKFD